MAKKSARRRQQARSAAARQAAAKVESRATAAPAQPAPVNRTADLAEEYRYVYGDLKRVGILAAAMLALLVAIALLAQYVF